MNSKWFTVWCGARVEVFEALPVAYLPKDHPLTFMKDGQVVAIYREWDYYRAFETRAAAEAAAGY